MKQIYFPELKKIKIKIIIYLNMLKPVYCLQFYIRLGPESPLDKRQIMENKLSSNISNMPQTWPRRLCS